MMWRYKILFSVFILYSRLRRGPAVAGLLELRVRISRGHWYLLWMLWFVREVSATGRSLVRGSATDCGVSLSVIQFSCHLLTPTVGFVEEVRLRKRKYCIRAGAQILIQSVKLQYMSKCLYRLQEWVLYIKTKKKVYTTMCPEVSGFWV
jgi:hypothetical protein